MDMFRAVIQNKITRARNGGLGVWLQVVEGLHRRLI